MMNRLYTTLLQAGADVNAAARQPRGFSELLDDSYIHCLGLDRTFYCFFF